MICTCCQKRTATIFLSQIINGTLLKVDLCPVCAARLDVNDVQGIDLAKLLDHIRTLQEEAPESPDQHCPHCGFDLQDYRNSGRLGCPRCYEAFDEDIATTLQMLRQSPPHTGKVPRNQDEFLRVSHLNKLREALKSAIAREDFEQAAKLRDELSRISGSLPIADSELPQT